MNGTTGAEPPVTVARRTHGAGPRLLLLHGLAAGESLWDSCLPLLPPDCSVWTAQLPWRNGGVEDWARRGDPGVWLRQALDAVPGGPEVVVAHSMAATLLLDVLHREAEEGRAPLAERNTRALALVSPFYRASAEEFDWETITYYLNDFHLIMEEGIRVHSAGRFAPDIQRAMGERVRDFVGPYGWMRFFDLYLRTPDLRVDRFDVPCLLLAGERDFAAPPGEALALAAALPDARAELLPETGHFPMIEDAAAFTHTLNAFLAATVASDSRTLEPQR
ncbi:alpha/beta fold hydrolase [Streptomyces sedi]|uniref:Alpha/beta hydrolase n=1 Tax=Streptomyces sedi TaxID=555059 RepID=A0A5C4V8H2_9ACTN|nr:alpha/beta hydrolase [Streptomyces sedi]TNM32193.1 alpha/beta hydrolase [Streptomyces sedi]